MVTVEGKLRSGIAHYRREAEDAAHAVAGARSKATRTELAAELKAAAWWEGRYAVLLEICESGRRPEELLAGYANRLPGRKVPEPPPLPEVPQAAIQPPRPARPAAAPAAAQGRRPAVSWRWALAVAASLVVMIALLQ